MVRHALDLVIENIGMHRMTAGFGAQQEIFQQLGKTLLLFGALVFLLAVMMGIFMYFMRQTIIVMSRLIEYDLRKEIFGHYEKLSLAFYKKNNTGDLMARITEDVSKVRMYLGPAILYGINLTSLVVMVIYSMLSVSVELTMYSLIPLPALSISIYYVSNLINKKSTIIQEQLSTLNSSAQEAYSGIRVLKSYVQEDAMGSFFAGQSNIYKEKSMGLVRINALFYPLMILLIGASTIFTVYIGGVQVLRGSITTGNIAEFIIYVNMLTWPVTSIGWVASIIQQAAASQKRINEFLKTEPDIVNHTEEEAVIEGHIEFDNVTFTYPDTGINALKDVSFQLKPGQKLAIIGKTGSGKSTVADLLLRMYDVKEGNILIDQKDIQAHNLNNLRAQIGYVPQDVFLFSNTVSGNIAFGRTESSDEEIRQSAKNAAVFEDIEGLTHGFDTLVGERGVTLSGGQKQRISIARALIKNPNIVILDDCLSAVDTTTEQQILSYLNGALADKTTIIITHRIYSLLRFDHIIVLDDGKIAEQGTHEALIANKGFYHELFEMQKHIETQIK